MKLRSILLINSCLMICSSWADENDCLQMRFVANPDQKKIQKEIYNQMTWRSSVHNSLWLTNSGPELTYGAISTNLCKCVLSKITPNRINYASFPEVSGQKDYIDAEFQGVRLFGIKVIRCMKSYTEHEYFIMKSNYAASSIDYVYDIYVLHKGSGMYEYVCDGVLKYARLRAFELKLDEKNKRQSY